MNIYEQQRANIRNTWNVITVFLVLYLFIGFGFDYFYLGFNPIGRPSSFADIDNPSQAANFPWATLISFLIGSAQTWWSMRFGDQAVLKATGAQEITASTTDQIGRAHV